MITVVCYVYKLRLRKTTKLQQLVWAITQDGGKVDWLTARGTRFTETKREIWRKS